MYDTDAYRRARTRARRTMTFWLRRQERRLLAELRHRYPTTPELARLAALRAELRVRDGRVGHV